MLRNRKNSDEYESDSYTNYNWCSWFSQRRIIKRTGWLGNKWRVKTVSLRSHRILRRVLEAWENLLSLKLPKKTLISRGSEKLSRGKIMIIGNDLSHNKRRCPWCNCYRRRKWTRRHEFKSWTRLIAFHIALIPLGKVWIQSFSLQLWVNSRTD